jgi:hypothetical protein
MTLVRLVRTNKTIACLIRFVEHDAGEGAELGRAERGAQHLPLQAVRVALRDDYAVPYNAEEDASDERGQRVHIRPVQDVPNGPRVRRD